MSNRRLSALIGAENIGADGRPRSTDLPSHGGRGRDLAIAGEAYEGSSRYNRDLALWTPGSRSADADILPARQDASARARDLVRNNAHAYAGEQLHRNGIVGALFMLNCKPNLKVLGIDDEQWEREFQDEVEAKFTIFAESPECWVDAARKRTLTELTRLAVGVHLVSGEVLASLEWIRSDMRPFSTAVNMVDVDRLSTPNSAPSGIAGGIDGNIRDGVEQDRYGAPVAYWIRDSHPSDLAGVNLADWTWTRYPARMRWGRQRVIHIFDQQRVGQTRGISRLVAALKEMKTTKNFREIMLQNAVVNATFAASIEAELPAQAYEVVGGGDSQALVDYAESYLDAVGDYTGGSRSLTIDGVRIPHLYPGQKLNLQPAGQGGPLGTEMEQSLLRYIAADLEVSYEELSRDYSQSNYSSMRAATIQTLRSQTAAKRIVADRFATAIFRCWFEEAVNAGALETMKGRPDFYAGVNKDAYTQCEWLGASRGQIDEFKETQAAAMRIEKNLSTYEVELGKLGLDWRVVFKQKAREKKMIEELGLIPAAEDPNNPASGMPQKAAADQQKEDDQNDSRPSDNKKKATK